VPVALLTVLLLGLFAAGSGWWLGTGRYTATPALTGLTEQAAADKAKKSGLTVKTGPTAYSEVFPVGSVISTSPNATERIRKGFAVTLTLSLGNERYRVSNLKGAARGVAEAQLKKLKLTPVVQQRYSDDIKAGTVLAQSPAAGTSVRRAAPITLIISRGPAPVKVPSVAGLSLGDAEARLTGTGLSAEVTRDFSETVAKDHVISQSPASGQLPRGATVKLIVSDGPPLVTVPDVKGKKISAAQRELKAAGFQVVVLNLFFGDRVINQSPGGGQQAPKGSTVRILR